MPKGIPFKKGVKPAGSGRKKGSKNKMPALLSDMILQALDAAGGIRYLKKQSKENPTAFMTLLGKIVPTHLKHSNDPTNPMPGAAPPAAFTFGSAEEAAAAFNAALLAGRAKRKG